LIFIKLAESQFFTRIVPLECFPWDFEIKNPVGFVNFTRSNFREQRGTSAAAETSVAESNGADLQSNHCQVSASAFHNSAIFKSGVYFTYRARTSFIKAWRFQAQNAAITKDRKYNFDMCFNCIIFPLKIAEGFYGGHSIAPKTISANAASASP